MPNSRIGALRVDLGMNTAAFEKGVTLAERKLNAFAGKMQKLGGKMSAVGNKLSLGLTAPLAFFGTKSAQAAIDAEEMGSAFSVVFGEAAADVEAWAERTGDAMGRSTQEIQRGALAFQELFGKALDPQKSVEMSKSFAVLTQDLASFKNLSNEVAQQKLFSGLSGEAEPLRAVGVFLSDAKVQAEATAMGLERVNGKLTEEQKIIARASVIQRELANAQGDVMRTSESTANQIKRSQAAFEELQVSIGTKLLPALTPLIDKLAGALEWFSKLPEPVKTGTLVVGGLAAALGPLLSVMGSLVTVVPTLAKALTFLFAHPIILGAAAVIGGIYLAWKNWDAITEIVRNLYIGVRTWLLDKLGAVFNWLQGKVKAVKDTFYDLYDAVVGNSYIPDMVDGIGQHMRRLQGEMVKPALDAVGKVNAAFAGAGDTFAPGLGESARVEALGGGLGEDTGAAGSAQEGVISQVERWQMALRGVGTAFGGLAGQIADAIANVINPAVDTSIDKFGQMEQAVSNVTSLMQSIFGRKAGGIIGGILQVGLSLGKAFGGFRANGGPVRSGKAYVVGERGPELFMPRLNGSIASNDALRSVASAPTGHAVRVVLEDTTGLFVSRVEDISGAQLSAAAPAMIRAGGAAGVARMQSMQGRALA